LPLIRSLAVFGASPSPPSLPLCQSIHYIVGVYPVPPCSSVASFGSINPPHRHCGSEPWPSSVRPPLPRVESIHYIGRGSDSWLSFYPPPAPELESQQTATYPRWTQSFLTLCLTGIASPSNNPCETLVTVLFIWVNQSTTSLAWIRSLAVLGASPDYIFGVDLIPASLRCLPPSSVASSGSIKTTSSVWIRPRSIHYIVVVDPISGRLGCLPRSSVASSGSINALHRWCGSDASPAPTSVPLDQ